MRAPQPPPGRRRGSSATPALACREENGALPLFPFSLAGWGRARETLDPFLPYLATAKGQPSQTPTPTLVLAHTHTTAHTRVHTHTFLTSTAEGKKYIERSMA